MAVTFDTTRGRREVSHELRASWSSSHVLSMIKVFSFVIMSASMSRLASSCVLWRGKCYKFKWDTKHSTREKVDVVPFQQCKI